MRTQNIYPANINITVKKAVKLMDEKYPKNSETCQTIQVSLGYPVPTLVNLPKENV